MRANDHSPSLTLQGHPQMSCESWSMRTDNGSCLVACKWQRRVPVGSLMRCRS